MFLRKRDLDRINTKNFHYSEFFYSAEAKLNSIINDTDNLAVLRNLEYTAKQMQKVRDLLESPITITSGYRCEDLNDLVGGSKRSYHLVGQAVDFICLIFGDPIEIIKKIKNSDIVVDQCIAEYKTYNQWVHVSFQKKPRNKFLIYNDGKYSLLD
jgi:zinc D-Ala-D-Ala carboxypeptidase